jgi:uncharacterized protein YukE
VIDLSGITALPALLGRVSEIRSSMLELGAPSRLAGDPTSIRQLAAGHLARSGRLAVAAERGRAQLWRLEGAWKGEANESFGRYWADLERRLAGLASEHRRMASALDGIASDCERLNRDVMVLLGGIDSWLRKAKDVAVAGELAAAGPLLSEGMALITGWERLLADLERVAGGLADRLTADLDFVRRRVEINVPRLSSAGFPLPGRRDRSPMGRGGGIRIGPWGRIPIPPPSPPISGRIPPGTDPWPPGAPRSGPRKRREPRARPPIPTPPGVAVRVGQDGPIDRRAPALRPGETPVHHPTVGPPEHAPSQPTHPPVAAPLHTPADAYVLQLATLVVMVVQKGKAVARRLRGRKTGGNGRGGGEGARRQ